MALVVLAAVLAPGLASACDTPVYEYTIHMWRRDPYRVWYFHKGAEDAADKATNSLLDGAWDQSANVSFSSIDVSDEKAVGTGFVREVWDRHKSKPLPLHVVVTPRGTEVAAERLTVDTAKALMDSAKRKEIAKLLTEGKRGVMVLLLGEDKAESAAARKVVQAVAAEAKAEVGEVGVVEVARDDKAEKWLVKQLLNLEDDLQELSQPMVFGIFGRAHALEPFVGKGIHKDNLMELAYFMSGPCSCEIKAMSPGMDLVTKLDWDEALENWVPEDPGQFAADTGLGGYTEIPITAPDTEEPETDGPVEQSAPGGARTAKKLAAPPSRPATAAKPVADTPKPTLTSSTRAAPERKKPGAGPAATPKPTPKQADGREPPKPPEAEKKPQAVPAEAEPAAELDAAPAEALAAEQEVPEEERGPNLPTDTRPDLAAATEGSGLSSRLAVILGFGLGGGTIFALVGGLAVMLLKREK